MKTMHNISVGTTLLLSSSLFAQTDTARTHTRGDRNTQITTSARTNAPRAKRTQNGKVPTVRTLTIQTTNRKCC